LQGEGFLQEHFLAVCAEWAGERVLRVAGKIENFDAGTRGLELFGEFDFWVDRRSSAFCYRWKIVARTILYPSSDLGARKSEAS
jgi:hypothetical protein